MRIVKEDLERLVKKINQITKSPLTTYTKLENGRHVANVGNYHLSWAYGGFELCRMNESGGVTNPLGSGHVSKKEMQLMLFAFIAGIGVEK